MAVASFTRGFDMKIRATLTGIVICLAVASCTSFQAYDGPERPDSETALIKTTNVIVDPGLYASGDFPTRSFFTSVDAQDLPDLAQFRVLPGGVCVTLRLVYTPVYGATPAIRTAEDGHAISKLSSLFIGMAWDDFPTHAKAIYGADDSPLREGDELFQKDLARSLRLIAEQGIGAIRDGELAVAIDKAMKDAGGFLALEDLKKAVGSICGW